MKSSTRAISDAIRNYEVEREREISDLRKRTKRTKRTNCRDKRESGRPQVEQSGVEAPLSGVSQPQSNVTCIHYLRVVRLEEHAQLLVCA